MKNQLTCSAIQQYMNCIQECQANISVLYLNIPLKLLCYSVCSQGDWRSSVVLCGGIAKLFSGCWNKR